MPTPTCPILNVTGPETVSIRWLAERLRASAWTAPPALRRRGGARTRCCPTPRAPSRIFGYPRVPLARMVDWVADWVAQRRAGAGQGDEVRSAGRAVLMEGSARRPLSARAAATRQRILDAALAEFAAQRPGRRAGGRDRGAVRRQQAHALRAFRRQGGALAGRAGARLCRQARRGTRAGGGAPAARGGDGAAGAPSTCATRPRIRNSSPC